jgi:hypothetical protein
MTCRLFQAAADVAWQRFGQSAEGASELRVEEPDLDITQVKFERLFFLTFGSAADRPETGKARRYE